LRCGGDREERVQVLEKRGGAFAFGHIDIDHGADFGGKADVGGEQKYGDVRLGPAHLLGYFAAVHSRHGVIEDDRVDGVGGEEFEAGASVCGGEDLVAGALQQDLADAQSDDLIVHT